MKSVYISSCVKDGGVYRYELDNEGKLHFCDKLPLDRPMYHIIRGNKMYVILRAPFDGNEESGIISCDIENGVLKNPTAPVSTKGRCGCHLWEENRDIYAVNYLSGNVIKLPDKVVLHEGKGPNEKRQESAHTHYVCVTPDKKYVFVCDLGLDSIFIYDRDLNYVDKVKVEPGHGVRHLVFSDDGKTFFAVNELKSTVYAFSYNNGKPEIIDTVSALPEDFKGESIAAAIRLHNGYIYVSNRGHDSIAKIQFKNNRLKLINNFDCCGKEPRDFCFVGDFAVCANVAGDNVTVFKVTDEEFILTDNIKLDQPLCASSV